MPVARLLALPSFLRARKRSKDGQRPDESASSENAADAQELKRSYARYCRLLELAEARVAAGDLAAAVGLAQIAARYAFPGNVGLFSSPRLERLLLAIGKQIPSRPCPHTQHREDGRRRILHVLSYGRPVGGDTRCAWRWMQEDRGNRHSVAITSQADLAGLYEVPEVLRQSAESSGGFLKTLEAPTSKPLEQAVELRLLCQEMDIVVLHLFPYDVVPVLALAAGCPAAKTLFVNHADHTFWIGGSVAHSIVHLRRQSASFLTKRRELQAAIPATLPIPLPCSRPAIPSSEAKAKLGYSPDTVLLVTIASPFKYSSPGQVGFLDLVAPVLARHPQAVLVAVGPENTGSWKSAALSTNGRIVPLGTRWDNDVLYAAADVYLDSVPFSSITSLLEAGTRGVPLLGYGSPDSELMLLGPGAPGLEQAMLLAGDAEAYRSLLSRLITDLEYRQQSGRQVQADILSLHTGKNWVDAVGRLYAEGERIETRGCLAGEADTFEAGALNRALGELYHGSKVRKSIAHYLGALDYPTRAVLTWRLYRTGFDLSYLNLLPSRASTMVRRVGRWAKQRLAISQQVAARAGQFSRAGGGSLKPVKGQPS